MNSMSVLDVKNDGEIQHMVLPVGWTEKFRHDESQWVSSRRRTFHPEKNEQVKIMIYDRARPISGRSVAAVQVATATAGKLNKAQIDALSEVLGAASLMDAFAFVDVRCEEWNGRNVLMIEGRWNELQENVFWMIVQRKERPSHVQEILFQAPREEYALNLKDARAALKSIVWI